MKKKNLKRSMLSGIISGIMLLTTVLTPVTVSAYTVEYPEMPDPETLSSRETSSRRLQWYGDGGYIPLDYEPLLEFPTRDTCITYVPEDAVGGGYYYMVGTTGYPSWWNSNEGIRMWRSADLEDWEDLGLVWEVKDSAWALGEDGDVAVWAPEVHYVEKYDNYYMTYSVSDHRNGFLKSASGRPEGPYVEIADNPVVAPGRRDIDGTLFEEDDGTLYYLWQDGMIAQISLKDEQGNDEFRYLTNPVLIGLTEDEYGPYLRSGLTGYEVEHVGFEGVFVIKIDGKYYLNCAESNLNNGVTTYDCMTAVSDNIMGPYKDWHLSVRGGGHNMFFYDRDGQLWSTYFGNDNFAPVTECPGILKMQVTDDGRLQPLWEDGEINLAQMEGAVVTGSSEYSSSYTADMAVDGDLMTRWAAKNFQQSEGLTIDLGKECVVSGTRTYFELPNQKYSYVIEISLDGTTWEEYANHSGDVGGAPIDRGNGLVKARYVKITSSARTGTTTNFLASMFEFQVYGWEDGITAEQIASVIAETKELTLDGTKLILPELPEGFSAEIKSVSEDGVIAADGSVTLPANTTDVKVVLTITGNGSSADSDPMEVTLPSGQDNLAAGKTIVATSTYSSGYAPEKAIDGDYATRWAADGTALPQSITVDLGSIYDVNSVETEFEMSERYMMYYIETSTDNENWEMFADRRENDHPEITCVDAVAEPVEAQYVRITVTDAQQRHEDLSDWASIREIRVYGSEPSEKSPSSISITSKPAKVNYLQGEELDLAGLEVTLTYDNGTTEDVTEECTVEGYDAAILGRQTITVTYGELTATFEVIVTASGYIVEHPEMPTDIMSREGCQLNWDGDGGYMPLDYEAFFDFPVRDTNITYIPEGVVGGGYYYMIGTTGYPSWWRSNEGVRMWRSTDLENWEDLGLVWYIQDSKWAPGDDGIIALWAPEIHYIEKYDNYYITYSVSESGNGILKSSTGRPEGPYVEIADNAVLGPERYNIDGSLFEDEDGTVYYLWQDGMIAQISLKDDQGNDEVRFLTDPELLGIPKSEYAPYVTDPDFAYDVMHLGFEGVFMTKIDGRYYLSCAEWNTNGGFNTYDCMVAVSDNIMGPYENYHLAIRGGGHNNFFFDRDGQLWSTYFGNDDCAPIYNRPGILKMEVTEDGRLQPLWEGKEVNLAQMEGAAATGSSEYGSAYTADMAVDGNLRTRWAAKNYRQSESLTIDFGKECVVSGTRTYFEKPDQKYSYVIETSLDGTTWEEYANHSGDVGGAPIDRGNGLVKARYVKITSSARTGTTNNFLASIYEFQVYGWEGGITAEQVASMIAETKELAFDGTKLILPELPEGFSAEIKSVSEDDSIAADGSVKLPANTTDVEVVLTITGNGSSADTDPMEVTLPSGQVNLAAGKKIDADSTYSDSYAPEKAIDGDYATRWAADGTALPQSITVDLGSIYNVNSVETEFEMSGRYMMYYIETSTDNENWELFADRRENDHPEKTWVDAVTESVEAQYVRITVTDAQQRHGDYSDWASIREIRVYGSEPSEPADLTELQSAVAAEKEAALVEADYTVDTWKAYADALAAAQTLLDADNLTQDIVDEAYEALVSAKAALKEKSPSKITITSKPAKVNYLQGEELDLTGLEITLTYDNGTTKDVTEGCTATGYDAAVAGTQTITVMSFGKLF